jgi:UDPglucose 6-dehydrogenase
MSFNFGVPQRPSGIQIAVIGSGYVGLTAGACFAYLGHSVVCTDVSSERVAALTAGEVPFLEPGLPQLVQGMVAEGRLAFSGDNVEAARDADFVFLCLPTPQGADGDADLSRVYAVAEQIGPFLRPNACVVNKSTVPVGTAVLVSHALGRSDVYVVSNPEFLAEGTALRDFLEPDRVVVGSDHVDAARRVATLYERVPTQMIVTDTASAEAAKYAANAYLAVRLSFVNSMAALCEAVGADVLAVMDAVGADHRIGRSFLKPGPGWGGSCFPKDTAALAHTSRRHGFDFSLLESAIGANANHHAFLVDKITAAAGGSLRDRVVAVWGLTFKAGTDDLRDSASLAIARELVVRGAVVRAYDPTVRDGIDGLEIRESAMDACDGAEVLFIGTEWPEFADPDLDKLAELMHTPAVVDGRNLLSPADVIDRGFHYEGVGLGPAAVSRARVEPQLADA